MKFPKSIYTLTLAALAAGVGLTSCHDESIDPDYTPNQQLKASIENGVTVDRLLQREITLEYNHPVQIVDSTGITINGTPVKGVKTDICKLVIPTVLEGGKDYNVRVAPGAVIRYEHPEAPIAEYTVSFKTRPDFVATDQLINPNASTEAKKVYAMLRANYGKKTLTGCMGSEAWSTKYYDVITDSAGKAPAIVGFDYMHLKDSPSNWIDYGDISAIKACWEAGAIPTICWHWNVPRRDMAGAEFSYAADSRWMPSNIFVEGSWENKVAMADIEKVAGYLKLLADAHIPVLFRPLHEAAGDYGYNNPWFWWGKEGPEVTKKLWNLLYDKLVNEYGLNNLIWVWTMQTESSGALCETTDKMRECYVGDDRCDIVGVDVYSDNDIFNDFSRWYLVREAIQGSKMIALSEAGNLPDVDTNVAYDWAYSYFMQWYDQDKAGNFGFGTHKYSNPENWRKVANMKNVLNRDDVKALLK